MEGDGEGAEVGNPSGANVTGASATKAVGALTGAVTTAAPVGKAVGLAAVGKAVGALTTTAVKVSHLLVSILLMLAVGSDVSFTRIVRLLQSVCFNVSACWEKMRKFKIQNLKPYRVWFSSIHALVQHFIESLLIHFISALVDRVYVSDRVALSSCCNSRVSSGEFILRQAFPALHTDHARREPFC